MIVNFQTVLLILFENWRLKGALLINYYRDVLLKTVMIVNFQTVIMHYYRNGIIRHSNSNIMTI